MAQNTSAKQLFDLLVSRNFDPELLDSAGKPASDPAETEVFSFDFTTESGNDYGTVVIMIGENNSLEVYFGDNVGKSMEGADKREWFDFLEQLKHFSTRNLMSDFSLKNLNRLRYSMQGQAAIKEGLFESWRGTKTVSYNDRPEAVRLMIRHKKPIGEGDARYRYVESLYVETADGERFKLPFTKLAGGRAMVEHVRNGGRPYDLRGQHIASVVEELNVLSRFRRANQGQIFEGNTAELISETNAYYENLNRVLKGLGTHRGYTNYFESWNPAEITEQDVVIESIKNLFVRETIDTRIEQALPVLAKIQKQGQAMKEANIFEAWANRLVEGTWATPDTPQKQAQLIELLSAEFPVGADATNATEQLYDLIGDDVLFDQLEKLADQDADADARQLVYNRLQELSSDPSIAEVLNQLNIDTDTPAEKEDPADEIDQQLDEMLPALGAAVGRAVAANAIGSMLDNDEEVDEGMSDENKTFWSNRSQLWAKLGNVVNSVKTPEQFAAAKKYAKLMRTRLAQGVDDGIGGDFTLMKDYDAIEAALAKKAKELGLDQAVEEGDGIPGNLPSSQNPGKEKLLRTPANKPQAVANKVKDVLGGIKDFVSGKPEDPSRPTYEADNLATFEGKCNMTAEGEHCPTHGLKECSMEEDLDTDGIMMTKPSNMSSESVDPMLARMKSLAGISTK